MINYAEHHSAGLKFRTAITEGATDFAGEPPNE
jgi:hypothetical protein